MTMRVDAVVAGAGPAGSLAAMLLAQRGWRVLMVDRGPVGRPKTCGHCLGPRALPLLKRCGLVDAVRSIADAATRRLSVRSHGEEVLDTPIDLVSSADAPASAGLVVDRRRLDPILQEAAIAAGAERVCPGVVTDPRPRSGCVSVALRSDGRETRVEAALLVAADGVGSGIARALGWAPSSAAGRRFGVSFQFAGQPVPRQDLPDGTVAMHLRREGYLGLVRQGELVHAAALLRPGVELERAMAAFARDAAWLPRASRDRGSFVGTGPLPWRPARLAAAGVALVGDAAGYAEPFTGEGMTWALESAELLVASVPESNDAPAFDATAAAEYEVRWHRRIGSGQRRCRWIAQALDRPWVVGAVAKACRGFPVLSAHVVRSVVTA